MSISPSKHNCFKICKRCHDMPQFALNNQSLPQFYLQYWLGQLMTTKIPIVQFWQLLKSIYHYHILNWGFEELWHCCSIQYLMVYNGEEYFYSCMKWYYTGNLLTNCIWQSHEKLYLLWNIDFVKFKVKLFFSMLKGTRLCQQENG